MRTAIFLFLLMFYNMIGKYINIKSDFQPKEEKTIVILFMVALVLCFFQDIRECVAGKK